MQTTSDLDLDHNHNFNRNLSIVLARSIVYEKEQERLTDLQGDSTFHVYNFDFGGSTSSSSSKFQRQGTTNNIKSTNIPSFLKDILQTNVQDSTISKPLASSQDSFLSGILNKDHSQVEGVGFLQSLMGIDPTSYDGKGVLQKLANTDTSSPNYIADTQAKYEDVVRQGLAQVSSGPDAVRGGQNRTALAQGEALDKMALNRTDEIRRAQLQDSGLAESASQIMAAIEAGRRATIQGAQDNWVRQTLGSKEQGIEASRSVDSRRGVNTGNVALAARELGTETSTVNENLAGRGNQSGSANQWGVNVGGGCCFIFLEALNGELPWYVRQGRDDFHTPMRRNGYVAMSQWLVPLMQKYKVAKSLVNLLMIKPFLKVGAWFYGEIPKESRWRYLKPYCFAWFYLWDCIGNLVNTVKGKESK